MAMSVGMPNTKQSWSKIFCVGFGLSVSSLGVTNALALEFSGFQWDIKDGNDSRLGPGPNRFRKENVWVDSDGRLHMFIRRDADGVWSCSEIILRRSIGYGRYTILLDTPVDSFHSQSVLGFFTWSDTLPYNEMDIEIARFRGSGGPNLFFSVQPNTADVLIGGSAWSRSEHTFIWSQGLVRFASVPLGSGSATIAPIRRAMRNGVPRPTATTMPRINFWLRSGTAPSNVSRGQLEVVIDAVEFEKI